MRKKGIIISGISVAVLILAAAALLLLKLGYVASGEKWSEYDDYGWA